MSENQGNAANGTTGTIDAAAMDPDLLKQLLELKAKDDERKAKLQKAADERKRTNNRGKLPDGTTDRNPVQAYLASLGALLTNWVEMYEEVPAEMRRRMVEQLIPSIIATSNTPSVQMASAEDTRRHDYDSWHAPHKASAKVPAGNAK